MAFGAVRKRPNTHGELVCRYGAQAGQQVFQGSQPELVVVPRLVVRGSSLEGSDPGDQRSLKCRPGKDARLRQADGHAEGAALPRLGEHQLAVGTRRCGRPFDIKRNGHGAVTFATPTIASRVTNG